MKGICLSGGSGSRWYPLTKGMSKQMLPLYDKPLVFYSISVLMNAGIRDILLITTEQDVNNFKRLFGDGKNYGINLSYAVQSSPDGLAQAFTIANECGFLNVNESCAMVLGDNVFHGSGFIEKLEKAKKIASSGNAVIFGIPVDSKDAKNYGIAEIDDFGKVLSIEEKPEHPKSNMCVTGLYFYPKGIVDIANSVKPSERGELEITSINQKYLKDNRLELITLNDFMWADCGTFDSLSEASNYVEAIEKRQGRMISCLEEIAYINNWITKEQLIEAGNSMSKNSYGKYLLKIAGN